jgi:plasmid stabilization system protein ParE
VSLRWAQAARVELEDAVEWYEAQVEGLGDHLMKEIVAATALIEQFPDAWHPLSGRSRSHRLNRFPYSLIYTCPTAGDVHILAFAHQHRRPLYWRDRLEESE